MQFSNTVKFVLLSLILVTAFSCRKKQDTLVEIHVMNDTNQAVEGADVRLFTAPPYEEDSYPAFDMSAKTNSEGMALFNFNDIYQLGQAGVALLKVEAGKDGLNAESVIKVDQETTTRKTLFL
ncbi:MAG: hypothetical protein ACI837_002158 [Crocinitomicaceae bacterium]|jgi:hypothetical protein